jgi:hypothetical protein
MEAQGSSPMARDPPAPSRGELRAGLARPPAAVSLDARAAAVGAGAARGRCEAGARSRSPERESRSWMERKG